MIDTHTNPLRRTTSFSFGAGLGFAGKGESVGSLLTLRTYANTERDSGPVWPPKGAALVARDYSYATVGRHVHAADVRKGYESQCCCLFDLPSVPRGADPPWGTLRLVACVGRIWGRRRCQNEHLDRTERTMDVGNSVRKAIDDWADGELDAAMLHACNAVDGTAHKMHFDEAGSNTRFTRLLRENYGVLGPMGAPGIDLEATRFPIKVQYPKASGGQPDFADIIYGIHRCHHGHGEALPDGFELLHDADGVPGITRMSVERGRVRLSDRVIFGLVAVAVLSPGNGDQAVPDGYHLTFGGDTVIPINEWWGKINEFPAIAGSPSDAARQARLRRLDGRPEIGLGAAPMRRRPWDRRIPRGICS